MPRMQAANWPMISGRLGVAEVHVVGDRERAGAVGGEVAPGFGDGLGAAGLRGRPGSSAGCTSVVRARARRWSSMRTTAASAAPGRRAVWPPTMLSYWSQIQRREQRSGQATSLSSAASMPSGSGMRGRVERRLLRRLGGGAAVEGRFGFERGEGDVGLDRALVADDDAAGVGEVADHGEVELPLAEDALGLGLAAGVEHHQHALLRLRQHHLVGGHAGLALRHGVEVELDAHAALAGHLDRGGW